MSQKGTQSRQSGFALGELLLAVVIVSVLVAIGYGVYTQLSRDTASQDVKAKTVAMVGKIRERFGSSGDFTSLTGTVVDQLGARPDNWRLSSGNLVDSLGNTVDINGSATQFAMRFTGLTKDNCANVASGLVGLGHEVNVGAASAISITAGVITGGSAYKAAGGAPNTGNLATGCGATEPLAVALVFR